MTRLSLAFALLLAPGPVLAVGGDDDAPPKPTGTTQTCTGGKVWDEKAAACTDPKSGALDDDALYQAARELAWAGQPDAALTVLAAMREGESDRVLTYMGFAHRKADRIETGMAYYRQALVRNPDNLLARSYMGQGLVEQGETALAEAQLAEIRARGGAGTWAEIALARAIETGEGYSY